MIYAFADCELDTRRFELRRAGEVLAMEPQVFELLRHLVTHRERVVGRDELFEAVWDGRIVSDSALSSRVKAARQAIGDSGEAQELIRTYRGRGFRFIGDVEERGETAPATAAGGRIRVAVLPFETLGGEPDQDYFGDGIAGDIINLLARNRWLDVLARGSSFCFRGAQADPCAVAESLTARYVVSGRVRRAGPRLRISAELIHGPDACLLWSEDYDRELTDLFAVQDEIAHTVTAAIEPELGQVERELAHRKPPERLDAWDCNQRGLWHLFRFTPGDLSEAERWFGRALVLDPELARAHARLAYTYVQQTFYGRPADRPMVLQASLANGRRAIELDVRDAMCHMAYGRALSVNLRFDEAYGELEAAIELNLSFAQAYFALAFAMSNGGRPREAIPHFDRAIELSPQDPHRWTFHHMKGFTLYRLGELDAAERDIALSVRLPNVTYWPHATYCAILSDLGRLEDARRAAEPLLRLMPDYSLDFVRQDFFFLDQDLDDSDVVGRYVAALGRAGIKER